MNYIQPLLVLAGAALWGARLGHATVQGLAEESRRVGVDAVIDAAFNRSHGSYPNPEIAAAFVNSLGVVGPARDAMVASVVDELNLRDSTVRASRLLELATAFMRKTTDPDLGPFAVAFNARLQQALNHAATPGSGNEGLVDPAFGTSVVLASDGDELSTGAGNEVLVARLVEGRATLQDADRIDAGGGTDAMLVQWRASADVVNSPHMSGIETLAITAELAFGPAEALAAERPRVLVNASQIEGIEQLSTSASRGGLVVQGVRLAAGQSTGDLTVAMVDTEPGPVDFGVYFDLASLRPPSTTERSALTLQLLDYAAAIEGAAPLRDLPFDGLRLMVNGQKVELSSAAFGAAQTYPELLEAIQALLASDVRTQGVVQASLGGPFSALPATGLAIAGSNIVLWSATAELGTGGFLAAPDALAQSFAGAAEMLAGRVADEDRITASVVLDGAGRGGVSGDLLVGAMPGAEKADLAGVARFDVTVERSSRLQNLLSSAGALEGVQIRNGAVSGDLELLGSGSSTQALAGSAGQHDAWGLNDVRWVDASSMLGRVRYGVQLSADAIARYGAAASAASPLERVEFAYGGGRNDDTIAVQVHPDLVAKGDPDVSPLGDFGLRLSGHAGNDRLTLKVGAGEREDPAAGAELPAWYLRQSMLSNVAISGGPGDDLIRTPGPGDVTISGDLGNDTIFVDNSGGQRGLNLSADGAIRNLNPDDPLQGERAVWLLNSAASVEGRDLKAPVPFGGELSLAGAGSLYRAAVTVSYKGLVARAELPPDNYRPTMEDVNAAIKSAVAKDWILGQLLTVDVAPSGMLVLKSMLDGRQSASDLQIALQALDARDPLRLPAADLAAAVTALLPDAASAGREELQQLLDKGSTAFLAAQAAGRYVARLGTDGASEVSGAASTLPSDNTIVVTPESALDSASMQVQDLVVMGTTAADGPLASSNDQLQFSGGHVTVLNFQAGPLAQGGDLIDFVFFDWAVSTAVPGRQLIKGPAPGLAGVPASENHTVRIHAQTPATDSADEVAQLFADAVGGQGWRSLVYVAVQPDNRGLVYAVSDWPGASDVRAQLMGTIDLADTPWESLTADNIG